ncbi:MAG TPA: helix-turn-helix transcriptional regulator [Erysipelotrichaceae bacterium]|nr:helix-turn-helix transcriptional regulator [Erysipelotrichaceae bacterium]
MGLEIIDKIRKEMKLSSRELSEMSGVPKGTLDKILNGTTKDPKLETLKAISRVLKCTLDDFDDVQISRAIEQEKIILLDAFNELNKIGKEKVVEYAKDLKGNKVYTSNIKTVDFKKEHLMPVAAQWTQNLVS